MAEAAVAKAVDNLLDQRGAWTINIHSSGMSRNGIADRIVAYKGRCLVIELKSATGRLRPLQAWELGRARRAGAITIVARHPDDVKAVLDAIDQGKHTPPAAGTTGPPTTTERLRDTLNTPRLRALPGGET